MKVADENDLEQALVKARGTQVRRLGGILIERGLIDPETLEQALCDERGKGHQQLGRWLVAHRIITEEQLEDALCEQLGIPRVDLAGFVSKPEVAGLIPYEMCLRLNVLPLSRHRSTLLVATARPTDEDLVSTLRFHTGLNVEPVLSPSHQISSAINRSYKSLAVGGNDSMDTMLTTDEDQEKRQDQEIESLASSRPVVRLVNTIILQAISRAASDIHFMPRENDLAVMFRIDGAIQRVRLIDKAQLAAVVARIKILGRMNIAEKRLPQDGHARVRVGGKPVDLRISVMPTYTGESVVVRILNKAQGLKRLDEIGFSERDDRILRTMIRRPQGMLLVTGPTGSGKSTTLYSVLQEVRRAEPHILTVEEPVEYDMEGVEQIQVNAGIGYTFARALRNILRHDPDVIMVGEIRDLETAEIATKAALTGHLVLSTLHTNDAPSAVTRLVDMGVEPYLVSSTVMGVLAQRLVRVICPHCCVEHSPDAMTREVMGVAEDELFWTGAGCDRCDNTGFHGRAMAYELLVVDRTMATRITQGVTTEELRELASEGGMRSLTRHALHLARNGATTLEEAFRVRLEDLGDVMKALDPGD